VQRHDGEEDVAAHQFQEAGGQDLADKGEGGEEEEDAFAEGDDFPGPERGAGQALRLRR
jgi:hypothetical protein